MKALGEGLERYSAGVYRREQLAGGSERTRSNPVSPPRFVRPESFETPDPEQRIEWVDGRDLQTDRTVSLPAEFVCFPPLNRRYRPAITTGLGLGNSTVEAVLSGLYEVIERDATMLAWYSTFEPLELAVDDEAFAELEARAGAESLTVTPLLVTQDVDIPVVAVAVHRETEWPQFAMGSGAALDPTAAARSALAEALQNWMELRAMGIDEADTQGGAIGEYAAFPAAAEKFIESDSRIPAESLGRSELTGQAELDAVCDRLAQVDLDAYVARLTTRDVEDLGFEAVRALIPSAQPLFTGEPFFGERARTIPQSLGFEPRLDRPYHPYP
jgi:ribosomal protein S12 methylthiotransferase accessory factor